MQNPQYLVIIIAYSMLHAEPYTPIWYHASPFWWTHGQTDGWMDRLNWQSILMLMLCGEGQYN